VEERDYTLKAVEHPWAGHASAVADPHVGAAFIFHPLLVHQASVGRISSTHAMSKTGTVKFFALSSLLGVKAAEECEMKKDFEGNSFSQFGNGFNIFLMLLMVAYTIIILLIGFYAGTKHEKMLREIRAPLLRRSTDKETQSQTTYRRELETPRFQPLGDRDSGCWDRG
jgi:hypothetical protein